MELWSSLLLQRGDEEVPEQEQILASPSHNVNGFFSISLKREKDLHPS